MSKTYSNRKPTLGSHKASFLVFILSIYAFRISTDYVYSTIIVKLFSYQGFVQNSSILTMLLSYAILTAFSYYAFRYKENDSSIGKEVIYILYVLSFIPFTTMVAFGNLTNIFIFCNTVFWALLFTYYNIMESRKRRIRLKLFNAKLSQKRQDYLLYAFLLLSFLVIVYISGRYTGFRINFNFLDVYDLRSEARMYAIPTLLKYLFGWTRAVNTILIAYYLRRKRLVLASVAFMLQVLSFGVDGSKSVFFYALCAVLINLFPRISLKKINQYVVFFLTLITIFGALIYKLTGNYYIPSIFTRRLLVLPVQLGQNYFDYFTTHTPDFYRGSFLKYFGFQTPYPDLVYLIGGLYYKSPNMGANNGLISDAITNMGYFGILIEPLLISWTLRALERSSEGLDLRIFITLALYTSIVMLNSFLPVVLLTHGVLVLMVILRMMRRDMIQWRNLS